MKGHLNKFGDRGLEILALTKYDPNNSQEKIDQYIVDHELPWAVVITDAESQKAYGVAGIPHSVLIDAKGIVRWIGHPMSLSDKLIEKLLAEAAGEKKSE